MSDFLFLSAAEPLAAQVAGELAENATQTKSVIEKFFDTFSFAKLVSAAILLVICIVCIKILLKATEKMLKSSKLDRSCHTFIRSSVKIVLVFLAIMLLAGTLGIDTSSLLAILSVAGLAVSLSIRTRFPILPAPWSFLPRHPFKVGDFIEVGGKPAPCARSASSTPRLPRRTTSWFIFPTATSPPPRSQTSPEASFGALSLPCRQATTRRPRR